MVGLIGNSGMKMMTNSMDTRQRLETTPRFLWMWSRPLLSESTDSLNSSMTYRVTMPS
uniref:Uncharacterized protein n=1 Tax=uncultured marine virus TaxID=186617 RepID=A0A0F7L4M1_9VIRU|nr:hypothetical protein [uncultured marine virus]